MFNNRFTFVGNVHIPKQDSKMKFVEESTSKDKKWNLMRMRFGMSVDKTNSQFAELFGGYLADGKGKVTTFSKNDGDKKGSKIEIPWKDRHKPDIVEMVADFKKFKVNLGEEKVFITEYDMIKYLQEELPNHKDAKFYITGDFKAEPYGDKTYFKFFPKNIKLANEDEKHAFTCALDVYFDKNSVSEDRFDEEKIIDVAGYVAQYQDKENPTVFVKVPFVINASKADLTNPKVTKNLEYCKSILTPKDDNFHHLAWRVNVFRGAEEVDFTEDMLTDAQKEQVELGLSKVEDFRPRNNPLGTNKTEFRLAKPLLVGDFANGRVDTGMDEEAFMSKLFKNSATKTAQAVKQETGVNLVDEDDDDLF